MKLQNKPVVGAYIYQQELSEILSHCHILGDGQEAAQPGMENQRKFSERTLR